MATFVLVHGAWGGGWEWATVARGLRARGHDAFTPTLTGLGERSHLLTRDIGLDTHTRDIANVLLFEDLRDVVLCAHSSSAVVAGGVAAERLSRLVYIDSPLPANGKSLSDVLPAELGQRLHALAETVGDGWRVPVPKGLLDDTGMPPEVAAWYGRRLVDHPLRGFEDPVRLASHDEVQCSYIRCTAHDMAAAFAPHAERARASGWSYFELATGHDPQILAPDALVDVLDAVARES